MLGPVRVVVIYTFTRREKKIGSIKQIEIASDLRNFYNLFIKIYIHFFFISLVSVLNSNACWAGGKSISPPCGRFWKTWIWYRLWLLSYFMRLLPLTKKKNNVLVADSEGNKCCKAQKWGRLGGTVHFGFQFLICPIKATYACKKQINMNKKKKLVHGQVLFFFFSFWVLWTSSMAINLPLFMFL